MKRRNLLLGCTQYADKRWAGHHLHRPAGIVAPVVVGVVVRPAHALEALPKIAEFSVRDGNGEFFNVMGFLFPSSKIRAS